jgi:hypothetical protein
MNIVMNEFEHNGEARTAYSIDRKCNGEFPDIKDLENFKKFIQNEDNETALKAVLKGE